MSPTIKEIRNHLRLQDPDTGEFVAHEVLELVVRCELSMVESRLPPANVTAPAPVRLSFSGQLPVDDVERVTSPKVRSGPLGVRRSKSAEYWILSQEDDAALRLLEILCGSADLSLTIPTLADKLELSEERVARVVEELLQHRLVTVHGRDRRRLVGMSVEGTELAERLGLAADAGDLPSAR